MTFQELLEISKTTGSEAFSWNSPFGFVSRGLISFNLHASSDYFFLCICSFSNDVNVMVHRHFRKTFHFLQITPLPSTRNYVYFLSNDVFVSALLSFLVIPWKVLIEKLSGRGYTGFCATSQFIIDIKKLSGYVGVGGSSHGSTSYAPWEFDAAHAPSCCSPDSSSSR